MLPTIWIKEFATSMQDIRRGHLAEAIAALDEQHDIDKVPRFFPYEHFYVIYRRVRAGCSPASVQRDRSVLRV